MRGGPTPHASPPQEETNVVKIMVIIADSSFLIGTIRLALGDATGESEFIDTGRDVPLAVAA
jgi:hypothetical protein